VTSGTNRTATLVATALAIAFTATAPARSFGREPGLAAQDIAPQAFPLRPLEGHTQGEALAINASGEVAGSSFGPGPSIGVVWDSDGNPIALEPLPGGSSSKADGINDAGTVVGFSRGPDDLRTAVMWGRDRVPVELARLPGHADSRARDINEAGVIVGRSWIDGAARPVRWSPEGAVSELSRVPGDPEGEALGINREGVVVGLSKGVADPETGDKKRTAMVWRPDGGATALASLPGDDGGIAMSINDAGMIVGEGTGSIRGDDAPCFFTFTAVVWDLDGTPRGLAPLSGDGDGTPFPECVATGRDAWDVSLSGVVVGYSASHERGIRWDAAGHEVALPPLPGDTRSWAYGVNEAGLVVGFSQGDSGKSAVVWISR